MTTMSRFTKVESVSWVALIKACIVCGARDGRERESENHYQCQSLITTCRKPQSKLAGKIYLESVIKTILLNYISNSSCGVRGGSENEGWTFRAHCYYNNNKNVSNFACGKCRETFLSWFSKNNQTFGYFW